MKSSNEVRLELEVLEGRIALSGAFRGAVSAGAPYPMNVLSATLTNFGQLPPPGINNQPSAQLQSFQSQLQSFQAAQTAMIDQFFSEMQSMFQLLNLQTILVL